MPATLCRRLCGRGPVSSEPAEQCPGPPASWLDKIRHVLWPNLQWAISPRAPACRWGDGSCRGDALSVGSVATQCTWFSGPFPRTGPENTCSSPKMELIARGRSDSSTETWDGLRRAHASFRPPQKVLEDTGIVIAPRRCLATHGRPSQNSDAKAAAHRVTAESRSRPTLQFFPSFKRTPRRTCELGRGHVACSKELLSGGRARGSVRVFPISTLAITFDLV